ncbi:hypothetical protein DMW62_01745 [Serratia marcescens]|uniref:Invasion protein IalB n=1 Tax=Serratia marcescens TaxID=615 RepID=A0ABX5NK04_SERMA|nr:MULTISPECIES: invasion associated locus B family protein [Serratia]MDI9110328.1 invasion associated locus B family protein [Serratia marcescens]MDR8536433.1 invasion associated locus B family protein [Serratia nevei]PXZ92261.1 hypothetical protein CW300_22165 [Serratia marcescens]PYA12870.1 hypothetical protein DMW42_19715 [Serratia marcescens]PYA20870.1 hypothetical protein DMW41_21545 [Serratia marcescens]
MKKILVMLCIFIISNNTLAVTKNKNKEILVQAKSGVWTLQCLGKNPEQCIIFSQFFNSKGQRELLVNFKFTSNNAAILYIGTPLNTDIAEKITLNFANNPSISIPYTACYKTGCMAQANVENMKEIYENKTMNITYLQYDNNQKKSYTLHLNKTKNLLNLLPNH